MLKGAGISERAHYLPAKAQRAQDSVIRLPNPSRVAPFHSRFLHYCLRRNSISLFACIPGTTALPDHFQCQLNLAIGYLH